MSACHLCHYVDILTRNGVLFASKQRRCTYSLQDGPKKQATTELTKVVLKSANYIRFFGQSKGQSRNLMLSFGIKYSLRDLIVKSLLYMRFVCIYARNNVNDVITPLSFCL